MYTFIQYIFASCQLAFSKNVLSSLTPLKIPNSPNTIPPKTVYVTLTNPLVDRETPHRWAGLVGR